MVFWNEWGMVFWNAFWDRMNNKKTNKQLLVMMIFPLTYCKSWIRGNTEWTTELVFDVIWYNQSDSIYHQNIFAGVKVRNENFNEFQNSAYVLSETFYGIQKSWFVAELQPVEVGTYTHFFHKDVRKFGQKLRFSHFEILLFWLRLTLGIPFLVKLLSFIGPTNVIWDFS